MQLSLPLFSKLAILAMMFSLFSAFSNKAKACIDPDSVITVTCNYDSVLEQVEMRLSNLRLMTEAPNKFCTCAIDSWSGIFTNLKYIAFVDSGTNNVYANFSQWALDAQASGAWDSSQPNNGDGWAGHVSQVLNSGLSVTDAVDLVIRAELPPGWTVSFMDSSLYSTYLGTDEWDNVNGQLAAGHQRTRNFRDGPVNFVQKSRSYFTQLDTAIITAYNNTSIGNSLLLNSLKIGPNPTSEILNISFTSTKEQELKFTLYDIQGRKIQAWEQGLLSPGTHEIHLSLATLNLNPANYLLSIETPEGVLPKRLVLR